MPPKADESWEFKAQVLEIIPHTKKKGFTVLLLWPDGTTTKSSKAVVYAKMPQTMLAYFESNLVYEDEIPEDKPGSAKRKTPAKSTKETESAEASPAPAMTEESGPSARKSNKRASEPERRRESGRLRETSEPVASSHKKAKKEEFFELDKIVDERMRHGKREYRLRWVGYGPSDDTWSPEKHTLEDSPEAVQLLFVLSNLRLHLRQPFMGICASCFGQSQDDASLNEGHNESTPLLQDPALVLAAPQRHEPNPEEQQREQEFLNRVVQHAAESLVDIKAFAQAGQGVSEEQRQVRVKQLESILDRLLADTAHHGGAAGDAEYVEAPPRAAGTDQGDWSLRPVGPIIVPLAQAS
ncbi:hypothetical protein BCR37DRAFT_405661 [Protomyces lactucae-debilis]|uniref:Chromo domain-containing protein n=1 Tax=Protomyces lactucae-debilis TaxID=2754530 RepID=A0A1Y2F1V1_PROLT|nr:uncharacterized protein BCR37DRAFT_405661 [Protomyces lactucae-debilis]ORY77830.1 hypothetical protein BCR37DRAFT_405661 [Protomyces lactucae-debilis]